jgi:hypothetical protein
MSKTKTWFQTNDEHPIHRDVVSIVNGNPKESFTAFAAITASGEPLPLFMVAKGTTYRCHNQLTVQGETRIFHSKSGWCNKFVKSEFLIHIRKNLINHMELKEKQSFVLVIDIFRSHFEDGIRDLAGSMGIDIIFIPAGQTGELQPLDATVFGELKSKAASVWTKQYTKDPQRKFITQSSSIILQQCWEQIDRHSFERAWKTMFDNLRNKVPRAIVIEIDTNEESPSSEDKSDDYQPDN